MSQEIGDIFTEEGLNKLKTGNILRFMKYGKMIEYKITKLSKKNKKCWVIPAKTYLPEEIKIVDKPEKLWKNKVVKK